MAGIIKHRYTLGLVILLLGIAVVTANEAVGRAMPWLVYAAVCLAIAAGLVYLIGFGIVRYQMTWTQVEELKTAREIYRAKADEAQAEAAQKQVMIITAKKGDQLVVGSARTDMVYTQLHQIPNHRINGHHEKPTDLELRTFWAYQNSAPELEQMVIDQQSVTSPDVNILDQYSKNWLETIVLPSPHVHLCGASGSGKTMLANHILVHIQKTCPDAEFYLLNPKHTAARAPFVIEPTYTDVEQAEEGLRRFIAIMEKRRNDPAFSKSSNTIVFVIDEFDYIKDMKGKNVTRLVNPLVKMGRELNIKVIIIGQSPLSEDTGLTQSSFYNMCRVAIWREGERLLKSNPMEKRNKEPLVQQYESLKALAPQYEQQAGELLRYCLVTPLNGNPSVQVIPYLEDPVASGRQAQKQIEARRPIKGSYHEKVCLAWYQTSKEKSPSGNRMHQLVAGEDARINAKYKKDYLEILEKYSISPGFLNRKRKSAFSDFQ